MDEPFGRSWNGRLFDQSDVEHSGRAGVKQSNGGIGDSGPIECRCRRSHSGEQSICDSSVDGRQNLGGSQGGRSWTIHGQIVDS